LAISKQERNNAAICPFFGFLLPKNTQSYTIFYFNVDKNIITLKLFHISYYYNTLFLCEIQFNSKNMKEKILALLLAQFTGVRKDGLNHLANALSWQVTTEDEAKTLVGKLTAEQVSSFITDWRKEADAEVTKANKTYEDSLRKKYDFTEKKTDPTDPTKTEPTIEAGNFDAAAIQKIVTDAVSTATKPLLEQINTFKAGETAKTRFQALNDKLRDCNDSNFKAKALKDFARMTFDTDEAFTEYLTETETDIKSANQNVADSGLGAQGRPFTSNTPPNEVKEATKEEIDAVMNKLPI